MASSKPTLSSSPTSVPLPLSPPPKASSFLPKTPEDDDEKPFARATGRDSSAARSRRRSLAHLALLDSQPRTPTHNRPMPLSVVMTSQTDLLPLLSPVAQSHSAAHSPDRPYFPGQPKSLAGIALRAFCLGIALAVGIISTALTLLFTSSALWRLPFFLAALATFHFLEFWTTAAYNTREADISSFLLTANWPAYAIAHSAAALECLLSNLIWPDRSWAPLHTGWVLLAAGVLLVLTGQTVRSAAMVQCGTSFNHIVQHTKSERHTLITTGIYAKMRHPSYFGFFWWGLGTQLVMGNAVCFVAYALVLWTFFSNRIKHEERSLVTFFGDEYKNYRKETGTKIPFVP